MIKKGKKSEDYIDISGIPEAEIASRYLGVSSIPCLIGSPLRPDRNPSFSLFSNNGKEVGFYDHSTKEHGGILYLLTLMWNCSLHEVKRRIINDSISSPVSVRRKSDTKVYIKSSYDLKCRTREWRKHDIDYWESYGITRQWLEYADVYPISHKIVIKDNRSLVFKADRYAYAYVERKEGKVTLKIYQPFNTKGFKWANKHDKSVISLWTKVPEKGNILCICSSLKDALCLWSNTGIPSIAVQGEGYTVSDTAIKELKRRFKKVYILFDNDPPGLEDGRRLSEQTGFINVILPVFEGGKDISDMRKALGKEEFIRIIKPLFKRKRHDKKGTLQQD